MTQYEEQERMDELSDAIDALNRGERPAFRSDEARELAEIAALLKASSPPPELMKAVCDTASAELASRHKRRRSWWISGAAGTTVAAMLVLAINITQAPLPPTAQMPTPPVGTVVIEQQPKAEQPEVSPNPAKPEGLAQQPVAKAPQKTPQNAPAASSQPVPQPPTMVEAPPAVVADAPVIPERRSLARSVLPPPAVDHATFVAGSRLALPGRKPDTERVEEATGVIQQVYGAGTEDEIIITQREQTVAAAAPEARAKHYSMSAPPESAAKSAIVPMNKVTVTVKGREVTVEGRLSKEKLMELASSLEETDK